MTAWSPSAVVVVVFCCCCRCSSSLSPPLSVGCRGHNGNDDDDDDDDDDDALRLPAHSRLLAAACVLINLHPSSSPRRNRRSIGESVFRHLPRGRTHNAAVRLVKSCAGARTRTYERRPIHGTGIGGAITRWWITPASSCIVNTAVGCCCLSRRVLFAPLLFVRLVFFVELPHH